MAPAPVVKALQEFEDLALRLLAALERGALQQFALDCGETGVSTKFRTIWAVAAMAVEWSRCFLCRFASSGLQQTV